MKALSRVYLYFVIGQFATLVYWISRWLSLPDMILALSASTAVAMFILFLKSVYETISSKN